MKPDDSEATLTLKIKDGMCYFQAEGHGEAYKILDFMPIMYDKINNDLNEFMKKNSPLQ